MDKKIAKFVAYSSLRILLCAGAGFTIGNILSYQWSKKLSYESIKEYEVIETKRYKTTKIEKIYRFVEGEVDFDYINTVTLNKTELKDDKVIDSTYVRQHCTVDEKDNMIYLYDNDMIDYLIDYYYDNKPSFSASSPYFDKNNDKNAEITSLTTYHFDYNRYIEQDVYPLQFSKKSEYARMTDYLIIVGLITGSVFSSYSAISQLTKEDKKKPKRIKK